MDFENNLLIVKTSCVIMKYLPCLDLVNVRFSPVRAINPGSAHLQRILFIKLAPILCYKYFSIGNEPLMKGLQYHRITNLQVAFIEFYNVHDVLSVFLLFSPSL